MTADDLVVGKNYFCEYTAQADPESFSMFAGQDIPKITVNGIAQIMKRDINARVCEVTDLKTFKTFIVPYDNLKNIEEINR
jgi:hypothetical protein